MFLLLLLLPLLFLFYIFNIFVGVVVIIIGTRVLESAGLSDLSSNSLMTSSSHKASLCAAYGNESVVVVIVWKGDVMSCSCGDVIFVKMLFL